MKIKSIVIIVVILAIAAWVYKSMFLGKTYGKGQLITIALKDLDDDIAYNKEKYDGKRIMFECYLGYANSAFSNTGDDATAKSIFSDRVYQIGVYNDIPEIKAENTVLKVLLPKTKGANGFDINKSGGSFTNDDVIFTANDKQKINYKQPVIVSADVKYFCLDNFNTKSKECSSVNPVSKKEMMYYNLVNVRIDKK